MTCPRKCHSVRESQHQILQLNSFLETIGKSKHDDLVNYELSLPTKYDVSMKGFCLYHQKDFDKFSEEQQQKLIEHHHKTLEIIHV